MRKHTHIICYLIALSGLSACSSTHFGNDQSYKFGEATHTNIAQHAIEPNLALKENTFIPADRNRVQAAREAYQTGNVKKLESSQSQLD